MEIQFSKSAVKALKSMEKRQRAHILEAIDGLTLTPPVGDIKPMEGQPDKRYRLRVGGYRVIFRYDGKGNAVILFVIDIGVRGDVYK